MNLSPTMPALDPHQGTMDAWLDHAPVDTARLAALLALEFEVLKSRDMAGFEALQEERITILERLSQVAQWVAGQDAVPVLWQNLQADLQQCKQDHLRNIQLLQRQLQAVKGALQALQGESAATVDLYDRLGQVSRRRGISSFLDA
ncbi:flagellar protein FlgN [Limnohabitans sp.]|jgi:flagellar biosynthesis/type III secretory pathway chaperone|uniref:flagellar protein FlgN n=1 Tax=Limnohabitans sp. TaxID=1907725 RepID=UPI0037C0EA1B